MEGEDLDNIHATKALAIQEKEYLGINPAMEEILEDELPIAKRIKNRCWMIVEEGKRPYYKELSLDEEV